MSKTIEELKKEASSEIYGAFASSSRGKLPPTADFIESVVLGYIDKSVAITKNDQL